MYRAAVEGSRTWPGGWRQRALTKWRFGNVRVARPSAIELKKRKLGNDGNGYGPSPRPMIQVTPTRNTVVPVISSLYRHAVSTRDQKATENVMIAAPPIESSVCRTMCWYNSSVCAQYKRYRAARPNARHSTRIGSGKRLAMRALQTKRKGRSL